MSELRCTECGAKTQARCDCHKPHHYIGADEAARLGVIAHPNLGDRQIARIVGVSHVTVMRARRAAGTNVPADNRTGQDGRRVGRRGGVRQPQRERARSEYRARTEHGQEVDARRLADEIGVAHGTMDTAVAEVELERAREPVVTRDMLSPSAQQRFDAAVRRMEATFESRVRTQVQADLNRLLGEMAEPRLRERERDAERIVNARRHGVFTQQEYNDILRCLHPDLNPTIEQKNEAFRMWHERKLLLLSNADDPREYPELPTLDELRRAYARRQGAR